MPALPLGDRCATLGDTTAHVTAPPRRVTWRRGVAAGTARGNTGLRQAALTAAGEALSADIRSHAAMYGSGVRTTIVTMVSSRATSGLTS